MVGRRQRQEPDLRQPGTLHAGGDNLLDRLLGTLSDGTGDHAGLAEATAPRASAEDLHRHAVMNDLGQRNERLLRIRILVPGRGRVRRIMRCGAFGCLREDAAETPIRQVFGGVQRRDVNAFDRGECDQGVGRVTGRLDGPRSRRR